MDKENIGRFVDGLINDLNDKDVKIDILKIELNRLIKEVAELANNDNFRYVGKYLSINKTIILLKQLK